MALTHIRRGDVVFLMSSGSMMHNVISGAQVVGRTRGDNKVVHAAIATGIGTQVCESVGSGLKKRPLSPGTYLIYAYRGPNYRAVRDMAALIAESFYDQSLMQPGFGDYNKKKAMMSPLRRASMGQQDVNASTQQFGAGARASTSFFCSNLIFRCYAGASETVGHAQLAIPASHKEISPADLQALLNQQQFWHCRNHGQPMQHP